MLANQKSGTIYTVVYRIAPRLFQHHQQHVIQKETVIHPTFFPPTNLLVDGTIRCRWLFDLSIFDLDVGIHSKGISKSRNCGSLTVSYSD